MVSFDVYYASASVDVGIRSKAYARKTETDIPKNFYGSFTETYCYIVRRRITSESYARFRETGRFETTVETRRGSRRAAAETLGLAWCDVNVNVRHREKCSLPQWSFLSARKIIRTSPANESRFAQLSPLSARPSRSFALPDRKIWHQGRCVDHVPKQINDQISERHHGSRRRVGDALGAGRVLFGALPAVLHLSA